MSAKNDRHTGRLGPLRVLLVTDGRGEPARIEALAAAAVAGGVRAVQVRESRLPARQLAVLCERLRQILEPVGGLVLVNDRVDVAAAGCAHGAHVGHRSLTPRHARRALGQAAWLGSSVHDRDQLQEAAAARCDYAVLAPVWPTVSKPGAPALGPERAGAWTAAAGLPVLWLGGVDPDRAASIGDLPAARRPVGIAVCSAICAAADPTAAALALVAACSWAGRAEHG